MSALLALLVEELLHVGARQQVRLRDAKDLERSLLGNESSSNSESLLGHLLALLVAMLLRLLVVLLSPVVQHSVAPRSLPLLDFLLLLASSASRVLLEGWRRLGCTLCPPATVHPLLCPCCLLRLAGSSLLVEAVPCLLDAVRGTLT